MKLLKLELVLGLLVIVGLAGWLVKDNDVKALEATYVVISEIQITGTADFVELYNPTDVEVNLSDYRLVKRTSTGTDDDGIVAFLADDKIPAYGFFLWCNNGITESLVCDRNTGIAIANNNSIGLRQGALNTGNLIDAVTLGTVANSLGEGISVTAPESGSVERKACASSTAQSMQNGDSANGNAWDTEDNAGDFVNRNVAEPQNSSSVAESPGCADGEPSPTPTGESSPTPTPTEEVTPTPTEIPTPTPTEEPTPTQTPTNTPTPTDTPTPTEEPSPTPTEEPVPTDTPTEEPTPTPTQVEGRAVTRFKMMGVSCSLQSMEFSLAGINFKVPRLMCVRDNGKSVFGR